ncbi:MAG TPA: peptidase MA family metallohydrolase, partial [Dehalococcoidia bacterium]|nr:peptidase MA family metallohydrolase [Dehalococcoidia bacterium]
ATYHLRSNGNPLYIPPGKDVRYTWQFTDANGAQFTTESAITTYTDTRFQWQKVSSGNLSLYFYRGSSSDATNLLNIGATAISKASDLQQTQLDFPVKLFAYASSDDFLPAAQKESKATDPGLLGQAQTPDTVILVAESLRTAETQDTVRHELTHLVTGAAVRGGFENLLPLWLNEGISVNAQANPGDYAAALQSAIRNDSVVPIQVLESSRGVDVGLFYGESYGLVKYLIDTGGQPKFAQLLGAIKTGKSTDQSLQSAYGFDRTGLYNAWRDSVHLSGSGAANPPSASTAATAPGANQPAANPTADTGPAPSRGGQGSEVGDSGTMVLLITLGGALVLVLIAAVIAFALALSRRARPS